MTLTLVHKLELDPCEMEMLSTDVARFTWLIVNLILSDLKDADDYFQLDMPADPYVATSIRASARALEKYRHSIIFGKVDTSLIPAGTSATKARLDYQFKIEYDSTFYHFGDIRGLTMTIYNFELPVYAQRKGIAKEILLQLEKYVNVVVKHVVNEDWLEWLACNDYRPVNETVTAFDKDWDNWQIYKFAAKEVKPRATDHVAKLKTKSITGPR